MSLFAASTHPGLKRDHNEDCFEADAHLGLWLVADGVGGHADGEVASAIVRDTIKADLQNGKKLVDAIGHAHAAVLDEIRNRDGQSNMGSTVVALKLHKENYEIAWVGDSRAYLFDGDLKRLTTDHSQVEELLANGAITQQEAANHPQRHVLSQSLGVSGSMSVSPGSISGRLEPGQQILLCSDGLTDELSDEAIADQLNEYGHPESQVDALVNAALGQGGRDNITAVLVGAPGRTAQPRPSVAADMETTQNIGEAVRSNSSVRRSHDNKIFFLLAIIVLAVVVWLL